LTFDNYYYLIELIMQHRSPEDQETLIQQFRTQCRQGGLALTHQREIIYRSLIEMEDHPSPEAIYERVREQIPSISLGTVYKNLHTFLEAGMLREVSLHHGSLRVDPNTTPHHHFVCVRCKSIIDLQEADLEPVRLRRRLPPGFQVERYNVEAQGVCATCSTGA
jgi:Fur family transcriptional regulator, peroxide stress response regulator